MQELKPCPYMHRCAHAQEDCTEERSATCELITNTAPAQPKKWNPQELVAIPLTMEQWRTVLHSLQNDAGSYQASMTWWATCCVDKKMGAETAAKYERSYNKVMDLHKLIEETLCPPTPAETE